MAKAAVSRRRYDQDQDNPLGLASATAAAKAAAPRVHLIRDGVVCRTDAKGFATPQNRSLAEIVVDASNGFIPLWARDVTLYWRFQAQSMHAFQDPEAAKQAIKQLFGEAILLWGDAAPVRFTHREEGWDFEVVMQAADDCDANGCVLASAFFPDGGQHELTLYPKLFTQSRQEQVETLAHEIGHIFGLRHFFANITETRWRSEIFGDHRPFSIMNYGADSVMTETDRSDLKRLYDLIWSGALTTINGTPIRQFKPFSAAGNNPFALALAAAAAPAPMRVCGCCNRQL